MSYSSGGEGPTSIAVGDLNRDGKVDLVVANDCGKCVDPTKENATIGVLLGNGDGTFQAVRAFSLPGLSATAIALRDFNGDGNLDVLVSVVCVDTNCSSSGVNLALGNGDGKFEPAASYSSSGSEASSVAVADLKGDGHLDVLVANSCAIGNPCYSQPVNGTFAVLVGNGDGTFNAARSYGSGGTFARWTAVADVNGDGKLDLIVANQCATNVDCDLLLHGAAGVLLGNGDGTFQAAVSYDTGGIWAQWVGVADLNGDGKPDLLVRNTSAENPSTDLAMLTGNGDGTFQPALAFASGVPNATFAALGDLNHDGKADLVITGCLRTGCNNGGRAGVLLGNGDGTFQPVAFYDSGGSGVATSVAIADLNGDGNPDLVLTNGCNNLGQCEVGVLLGNGDGTFQPVVRHSTEGLNTFSVAVGDVNGDGRPDLVVAGSGGIGVLLGRADGLFQKMITTAAPVGSSGALALGDFDSDGFLDAAIDAANLLLFGNGDGTFRSSLLGAGVPGDYGTAVGDFDGNGKPDLALGGITILLNVKASTATVLSSSLNPSIYGQKVTFTAMVTGTGGSIPTGTVAFTWGGGQYLIGTATLNSSGVAILTRSNLNAGLYPLTAVYKGNPKNQGSTSAVLNQLVESTTSAATLTSSPSPSTVGQAVTFEAKITSPTVTPTGPVTFRAGTTVLGTVELSGGKATLITSSLPVGSNRVTVRYAGSSDIAKSSASVTQVVQP